MWTLVEGAFYAVNFAFCFAYYKYLERTNNESLSFLIANCFLNVIHTCWLIYGNTIYWPNQSYLRCAEEAAQNGYPYTINWQMGFLLVIGYITLCKCCAISTVIVCFAPQIVRAYRRANNPAAGWQPTSTGVLKNIVKRKF